MFADLPETYFSAFSSFLIIYFKDIFGLELTFIIGPKGFNGPKGGIKADYRQKYIINK